MSLKTSIPVALYRECRFKKEVHPFLCEFIETHKSKNEGLICFQNFNKEFSPIQAASVIYEKMDNVEQYNRFQFKKWLFIKEIAYVIERYILYLLYAEFEKQEGRIPKPYDEQHMFYNVLFQGTVSLYEYKVDEKELVLELIRAAAVKGMEYLGKGLSPVPNMTVYQYNGHGYEEAGNIYDFCAAEDLGFVCIPSDAKSNEDDSMKSSVPDVYECENKPPCFASILPEKYSVASEYNGCSQFANMKNILTNGQIISIMKRHHYNELNAALIAKNMKLIKDKYAWVLSSGGRMDDKRADSRSALSYKIGTVCAWILEDYIRDLMNNWFYEHGYPVHISANGADSDRVIQTDDVSVKSDPDYQVHYKGRCLQLEECTSYTGLFTRSGGAKVTFRNNKRIRIMEKRAAVMCVEVKGEMGFWNWKYMFLGKSDLERYTSVSKNDCLYKKKAEDVFFDGRQAVDLNTFCQMLYLRIKLEAGEDISSLCCNFPKKYMDETYKDKWIEYIRKSVLSSKKNNLSFVV